MSCVGLEIQEIKDLEGRTIGFKCGSCGFEYWPVSPPLLLGKCKTCDDHQRRAAE